MGPVRQATLAGRAPGYAGGEMSSIWQKFEDLTLQFLEARVSELLTQGDVAPDPRLIARIRADAAYSADRAVARFQAGNGVEKLGNRRINS
jgi:hypothetical protein